MSGSELTLPEALLLLALKDETGERSGNFVEYALAGAALAELVLQGILEESAEKKNRFAFKNEGSTGDAYLDGCIEIIQRAGIQKDPKVYLQKIAHDKVLTRHLHEELIARGILKSRSKKVFFFFTKTVYPEADPSVESALRLQLESVMFNEGADVSARDTVLISLLKETNLLTRNFDRDQLKTYKDRIKRISKGEHLATNIALEAMQAVKTAIIVTTVIIPAAVIPAAT